MRTLVIPARVFRRIERIVADTPGDLETGVTLFGTSFSAEPDPLWLELDPTWHASDPRHDDAAEHVRCVVLAVAGPGKKATHETAFYSADDGLASEVYNALLGAMPGIRWLGELHVHPPGMTWLSSHDRRTVQEVLTHHSAEFVAGIMQRGDGTVRIYPHHFSREWPEGKPMELCVVCSDGPVIEQAQTIVRKEAETNVESNLSEESARSPEALSQTSRYSWLWQCWEFLCRYGSASRDRKLLSN